MCGMKAGAAYAQNLRRVTRRCCASRFATWLRWLLIFGWCILGATAAPKKASRDLGLDLRQGVALSTQQKYGQMYQSLNTWLRLANCLPMAELVARGNLALVNEVLVAYLQYMYETGRPYSHGPFTLAAVQYFHRSLWGSLKSR